MAVQVKSRSGKPVTLLNPKEKSDKYKKELKNGVRYNNDGTLKKDKDGKVMKLTDEQRAFRGGYRASSIDGAKAHSAKKSGIRSERTQRRLEKSKNK